MRWQDIKTSDDLEFWRWERLQEAITMEQVYRPYDYAQDAADGWRKEADRLRKVLGMKPV